MGALMSRAAIPGMGTWRAYGLHAGMVPCYRSKARHASWRWGKKKGLRRARRRLERIMVARELQSEN